MNSNSEKVCKYCLNNLEDCTDEGLTCTVCSNSIHLRCLKQGSVPSGLHGDTFYIFTCQDCSDIGQELYLRDKVSWLKVSVLVLYHLQTGSPGLAKKGFYHWKEHVASFIEKNWETLFQRDFKKKKKWIGTLVGTLSHFTSYFFKSGTSVINKPAWWALTYPKLTPNVISNIYTIFTLEKQKAKLQKLELTNTEIFQNVLNDYVKDKDLLTSFSYMQSASSDETTEKGEEEQGVTLTAKRGGFKNVKRKTLLPTFQSTSKRLLKLNNSCSSLTNFPDDLTCLKPNEAKRIKLDDNKQQESIEPEQKKEVKLLDPMCHYNTSLHQISESNQISMIVRLTGGFRADFILSPYSGIHIPPFIRRDVEVYPTWVRLMIEVEIIANRKLGKDVSPIRYPLDYVYVQLEHIPAINSLCNNFFWPGIDLSESLQYPEYSCVAMYKKLIVGFAFMVPNVTHTENYLSFIFTRPGWRHCGIAEFMLYHLTQVGLGKDITLHVALDNPALCLYQKFGFKVESVILNFYDTYIRNDTNSSKNAYFCRLER